MGNNHTFHFALDPRDSRRIEETCEAVKKLRFKADALEAILRLSSEETRQTQFGAGDRALKMENALYSIHSLARMELKALAAESEQLAEKLRGY